MESSTAREATGRQELYLLCEKIDQNAVNSYIGQELYDSEENYARDHAFGLSFNIPHHRKGPRLHRREARGRCVRSFASTTSRKSELKRK